VAELMNLIGDVEGTIAQRSTPARERTLSKITELLVRDAERLDGEQLALFDHVLGCFTPTVPGSAKADLAQRLAELGNAPPNVTRTLAFDEDIVVAHAILSKSSQLSDQDLIEIAILRGSDHMSAISERRHVSELVTDVLVTKGDDKVWRAIAGNDGARFSTLAKAELLDRSREDETLQDLLGAREDLTDEDVQQLVTIAREAAKARLTSTLAKVEEKAAIPPKPSAPVGLDYPRAQEALRALTEKRRISEFDIASFANKNRAAEAICAISLLAHLPIPTVERAFRERDDDLILVIGKANNWSWRTVRALLGMRDPLLPEPSARPLEPAFDAISPAGARRALLVVANAEKSARSRPAPTVTPDET
jgi:hypothetical protein